MPRAFSSSQTSGWSPASSRRWTAWIGAALVLSIGVGVLGRGYWTPDEPREADIAWRMSWQEHKAIPLLAGEPFCEKPPFTYWVAGAAIAAWGDAAWVARLPNLLYALATVLAVGCIGRRSAGAIAGIAAAAAIGTFLLAYQVAIWLATDAPLLAASAVALLGLYRGFYAANARERLAGYSCMHAALAVGFLSKSAAAWMVPALTLAVLIIWEKRWREVLRPALLVGLVLQAAIIGGWVWVVYTGPDGLDHLKVFFWNNLVGRFAHVDAPEQLQYATAHRNTPGKYLIELPAYLWPWTLLVIAAMRSAWRQRHLPHERQRAVRFAAASFLPTLGVLSVAATARNIYLAPALPGIAVLLGWWAGQAAADPWDVRALRGTAIMILLAAGVSAAALGAVAVETGDIISAPILAAISVLGLAAACVGAVAAWQAAGAGRPLHSLATLLLAYAALLIGPASQIYAHIDAWQDLPSIGRAMRRDAQSRPLILFAPDETTRAFVDQFARSSVNFIPGPVTAASVGVLRARLAEKPDSMVVTQLAGRSPSRALQRLAAWRSRTDRRAAPAAEHGVELGAISDADAPAWATDAALHIAHGYALPNGRRYAILEMGSAAASR